MLNKLKKVTNASENVIDFLNKDITQIIKGNRAHAQNNAYAKSAISVNKVQIENNTASNTRKKTHKKLFKNVLKQIKSVNKVHKQYVFDNDKCKKLHKELLIKCLLSYYLIKMQNIKTHLQILTKHMLMMLNVKHIRLIVDYIITYYTVLIRFKK